METMTGPLCECHPEDHPAAAVELVCTTSTEAVVISFTPTFAGMLTAPFTVPVFNAMVVADPTGGVPDAVPAIATIRTNPATSTISFPRYLTVLSSFAGTNGSGSLPTDCDSPPLRRPSYQIAS